MQLMSTKLSWNSCGSNAIIQQTCQETCKWSGSAIDSKYQHVRTLPMNQPKYAYKCCPMRGTDRDGCIYTQRRIMTPTITLICIRRAITISTFPFLSHFQLPLLVEEVIPYHSRRLSPSWQTFYVTWFPTKVFHARGDTSRRVICHTYNLSCVL